MNPSPQTRTSLVPDPEATLRLLAQIPPPQGLADRVHRRLAAAPAPAPRFWSLWLPAQRLQFAAAALLVTALAASSWTIYENRQHTTPAARTTAPQPPSPQPSDASSFTPAGAERLPASLKPIKVPPAPKKKPSATKSRALKPSATPAN
jgi:hypothetical protein